MGMLKKFRSYVQSEVDRAPAVYGFLRWMWYVVSGYYGLLACIAPIAEYCFIGKYKFYKTWQKVCFSFLFLGVGYGFFRGARFMRPSCEKTRLRRVA